jgi:hypothetical protein
MLYFAAIISGVIFGLLARGKISNLFELKFEKAWIIMLALFIQVAAQVLSLKGVEFAIRYSLFIQGIMFCMVIVCLWYNRRYIGVWFIGLGCILNALVMMLNDGKMPISYNALAKADLLWTLDSFRAGADGRHTIVNEATRLPLLADTMHPPFFFDYFMKVVSIGDLIVIWGLFLLVLGAVTKSKILNFEKLNRKHYGGIKE